MQRKKSSGFTLIELLVVIAIIGILSTLAIVALGSARQKARDSKRVSDLSQIGKALELYFSDQNNYPLLVTSGQPIAFGSTVYLEKVPSNPLPRNDGSCTGSEYGYTAPTDQASYSLGTCLGSATGSFPAGGAFISSLSGSGPVPCGQAVVVDRDGYTYRTVQIGTQCWMAENLRTRLKPDGTCINGGGAPSCPAGSNGSERDCISSSNTRGTEADCAAGYALYTWAAAMNGSTTAGAQGICPAGWHIPTDAEQNTLDQFLTSTGQTCDANRTSHTGGCSTAGDKLKSTGTSGFNVAGGGRRVSGNSFTDRSGNYNAYFWSSSEIDASNARTRDVFVNYSTTGRNSAAKTSSYFVRCIKD